MPFVLVQIYPSPLEKVWAALTEAHQMCAWYFPQLRAFEPVVGFAFEFTDDGSPYRKQWRVTQLVAGERLAHSWRYQSYPGHSEVTFDLVKEGTTTRLTLTHTGLARFPQDPHFARHRFENGWQPLLGSKLKNHLET